jgi:hypothetical protein
MHQDPVTRALVRTLQQIKQSTLDEVLSIPEDAPRDTIIRKLERAKIYSEILDFENLLLGELEDES